MLHASAVSIWGILAALESWWDSFPAWRVELAEIPRSEWAT